MSVTNELLFDNRWVQLRQIVCPEDDVKGYVFSHEVRCHGKIVLVVPYRRVGNRIQVAYRIEVTPCWGMEPCESGLTGGVEDENDSYGAKCAKQELKEESGYTAKSMAWLGRCRSSKSSDTWYYLWGADVTGRTAGEALGDGSKQDSEGTIAWCWIEDVHSVDAQFTTACDRLRKELGMA